MRTRAQTNRDAALRRLTRVNHSIAVAAVIGAGVVTDLVAHTASGHAATGSTSATGSVTKGSGGVELLTGPRTTKRRAASTKRRTSVVHHSHAAVTSGSRSSSSD